MTTQRQGKLASKKMTDNVGTGATGAGGSSGVNPSPRPNPWGRGFASPQMNNSRTLPTNGQASPAAFPPLNAQSPKSDPASPKPVLSQSDSTLATLSALIDNQVMVFTKDGARYQGTIVSTVNEIDNMGVNLKEVKNLLHMNEAVKNNLFIHVNDILGHNPVVDKTPTLNGSSGGTGFRTDTDITNAHQSRSTLPNTNPRERQLEAWQPPPSSDPASLQGDDLTFGQKTTSSGVAWDQFEANETMFGVKTSFDENIYTTKLDRSRPDYKERERQAQIIADEIMGGTTNNPHLMEERGLKVDDSGLNEEDKYGAVVRGPGAYVPPGARHGQAQGTLTPLSPSSNHSQVPTPTVDITPAPNTTVSNTSIPTITKQDGNKTVPLNAPGSPSLPGVPSGNGAPVSGKGADGLVNDFRSFVKNEKNRLNEKRHALAKNEMDKRKAELLQFSQSFKLNKPIPDDLVTILAKDEDKQKAIREKSVEDAASGQARVIGPSITTATVAKKQAVIGGGSATNGQAAIPSSKVPTPTLKAPEPAAGVGVGAGTGAKLSGTTTTTVSSSTSNSTVGSIKTNTTSSAILPGGSSGLVSGSGSGSGITTGTSVQTTPAKKAKMTLQAIPPFNPNRSRSTAGSGSGVGVGGEGKPFASVSANVTGTVAEKEKEKEKEKEAIVAAAATASAAAAATRLNINASSFKPTTASGVKPSASTSSGASSAKTSDAPAPPNPFFGTKVLNKKPVHLKDDFNPFKGNTKIPSASQISERWPYTGKRFSTHFGPVPQWILNGPGPHLVGLGAGGGGGGGVHNVNVNMNVPNPPPGPGGPIPNAHLSSPPPIVGVPPPAGAPIPVPVPGAPGGSAGSTPGVGQPGYDDPNGAPAPAAGGYVYYTHYPYPSMIPGVPQQHGYMHPQYIQAMPYAPNMGPPNGPPLYSHQPMPGMPPPHFMAPPPGAYVQAPPPPPGPNATNGHPRPSMPTPVPSHAHAYPYHQSPQMQHAVPYHPTMLMQGPPPPGGAPGPAHMYEGGVNGAPPPPSTNSSSGGPGSGGSSNSQHSHSHTHPQHHNQHHHNNHQHTHQQQHHPHHPQGHHPQQQQHQSPTSMSMMASNHS